MVTPNQSNGISLAALIVSISSFALLIVFVAVDAGATPLWISLFLGLIGLILAIIALVKKQSKGMAITALIISILSFIVAIGLFIFALIFVGALFI